MQSLNIAATGMMAQQLNVEVISNNIANMRTTGFKRQRAEFQDLLYQNLRRIGSTSSEAGTIVPSGVQVGAGVKTGATYRIMTQGTLARTEKTLDLALRGEGYFQIDLPDGRSAFTRDGSFERNADGNLVTLDGYTVQPGITIPADARSISINAEGTVEVLVGTSSTPQTAGQISLARFSNPAGLEGIGDNLFLETPSSGAPSTGTAGSTGFGNLSQGYLEQSNVNSVSEISDLIMAQRAYEMNTKVITVSDEMMSSTANLKR